MKTLFLIGATVLFSLTGCTNHKTTTEAKVNADSVATQTLREGKEERNKQIALQCIKAWSNGNIDEIVSHLAPNTADLGDESTPPARGIDRVKYFMQTWNSSVNDYKADHEVAVADGDYVFVYAGWSGTFKKDFMGMKTTGKSFKFKDVDIFKFNDEHKIAEHRAVHFSTVLKQLAAQSK